MSSTSTLAPVPRPGPRRSRPRLPHPGRVALWATGHAVAALGIAATLVASVGVGPGDVFLGAVSDRVGIAHGSAGIGLGLALIVSASVLGRRPTLFTLAGVVVGNLLVNVALSVAPAPATVAVRVVVAALGLATIGVGIGAISVAGVGRSTAELFTLAVREWFGVNEVAVRIALESALLVAGLVLGGPVGLFTVVVAAGIGPSVAAGTALMTAVTGRAVRRSRLNGLRLSRL